MTVYCLQIGAWAECRNTELALITTVGEGVSMPMRICFTPSPIERRPRSASASFSMAWANGKNTGGRTKIEQTVARWRRGVREAA